MMAAHACYAALAAFLTVANADYVITRNGVQSCTIKGDIGAEGEYGKHCCSAPKAQQLSAATFCFDDSNMHFTVDANKFGTYTLGMGNVDTAWYWATSGSELRASWNAVEFTFNYGGVETISSDYDSRYCHGKDQCCNAESDGCCVAAAKGHLDAVKICSTTNDEASLETMPTNGNAPSSYYIKMGAVPYQQKGWATYWRAKGGPFFAEDIMIEARSGSGNSTIVV